MTATADAGRRELWSTMPGWGIVGDLTPPELLENRRLRILRRVVVLALVVVVAACVLGWVVASSRKSAAGDQVAAATSRTAGLLARGHEFADVTAIHATSARINQELSAALDGRVDCAGLLSTIRSDLPVGMAITSVDVGVATQNAAAGTTTLDTSGRPRVGAVTLSGTARHLTDVATYVTRLGSATGFVDVVPTDNSQDADGTSSWTVTFSLTDALQQRVTHYTAAPGGR